MPHLKDNKRYTEIKDMAIYCMMVPAGPEIYIGQCEKRNLRNHYRDHYNLYKAQTRPLIEALKKKGLRPEMYLLEEIETTKADAYKHVIAWVKYFLDQGFQPLNQGKTYEYVSDPLPEVELLYNEFMKKSIDEIICKDQNLFPNYGLKTRQTNNDQDVIISFRVTPEEAKEIKALADKKGVSVSQYVRETSLDGVPVHISFEGLAPVVRELRILGELIKKLVYTIYKTQNYTPSDLALVQEMGDKVAEIEANIREEQQKTMKLAFRKFNAARKR